MNDEIAALEQEIMEKVTRLNELRKRQPGQEVPNYRFQTQAGETTLLDMFGDKDLLLVIHNMGQGCRYCTLWADGFNGLVPHLEDALAVVLVSGDDPATQRAFANSRGWKFRLASHAGSDYSSEQTVLEGHGNMPGAVVYERQGETILRKNDCVFGPNDIYCPQWTLLGLAGIDESTWIPQFRYWQPSGSLLDGGERFNEGG